jgi:alpha,alpha-trehalase
MILFNLNIETTLQTLLLQEDTDGDKRITIEDEGLKAFKITANNGQDYSVKGTYYLSNLLQELVIARNQGKTTAQIKLKNIEEPPVHRITRMIRDFYWNGLTRTMDEKGIQNLINDTKNKSLLSNKLRVYIPFNDHIAFKYYKKLENNFPIEAIKLPEKITPHFVKSINTKPGILSLKLKEASGKISGVPFVVPGGRFNEMYGWDSYFQAIGLIIDGKIALAQAVADHFQYQIEHYGKILNANRSYYLTRTQPPFYSSLIFEIFKISKDKNWLKSHLKTAIHEYETVWMLANKRLTENGLNRFQAEGIGITPEAEEGHYDTVLQPFAKEKNLAIDAYQKGYEDGTITNNTLDTYFLHDRTVRESGHDTSYRLEGNCADLNLVELNAFLYKYEVDFAQLIKEEFNDHIILDSKSYTSDYWTDKAAIRQKNANKFLWNKSDGLYYDYNVKTKKQLRYISATTFTPLWSKMATQEQAEELVKNALPLLLEKGGILGGTKESRGIISNERPAKQWDYPNGWPPHQMLIWKGLLNYGFTDITQELIYRWLHMITKNAVDYNGTIPEKYDVVHTTHKVFTEYGNVGTDFEYITREGFGWMNASFQYGLSLLKGEYLAPLNKLIEPELLF